MAGDRRRSLEFPWPPRIGPKHDLGLQHALFQTIPGLQSKTCLHIPATERHVARHDFEYED